MLKEPNELRQTASSVFSPELAEDVISKINKDEETAKNEYYLNSGEGGFSPLGPTTFYLGDRFYNQLETGEFTGYWKIQWNGTDKSGLPKFKYLPDANEPFAYRTSLQRIITPQIMDTDGGSIPRIFHIFKNLSPWKYAPAYIIHDWIFLAHQKNISPDNDINFEDSALILAESIKTMMTSGFRDYEENIQVFEKSEDTLYLIYLAVSSFIAKKLWNK